LQVEVALTGNGLGCFRRHDARLGQSQAGRNLHLKPAAKFIFITPDFSHFRARITGDQGLSSREVEFERTCDDKCRQAAFTNSLFADQRLCTIMEALLRYRESKD